MPTQPVAELSAGLLELGQAGMACLMLARLSGWLE